MKDLKDYLHLYLLSGIDVFIFSAEVLKNGWLAKTKAQLPSLNYSYVLTFDTYTKTLENGYLPILRPLSAMTDREVLDVVSIVLRKEIDFLQVEWTPKRDYVVVKYGEWLPQGDYEKERWEKCELNIAISDDFTIYNHANYIKGNGTGAANEPLYKQHESTKYLLSRGFDLFNLIPEGLAIDKTTLTQQ